MIYHINRIMRNGTSAPADMVVVCADRDVLIPQLRVTAANHAHDVSRRIFYGTLVEPGTGRNGRAGRARLHAVDVSVEQRIRDSLIDVEKRWKLRISVSLEDLSGLLKNLDHLRRHRFEACHSDACCVGEEPRHQTAT